jgi:hypothetical protein
MPPFVNVLVHVIGDHADFKLRHLADLSLSVIWLRSLSTFCENRAEGRPADIAF